MNEFAFDIDLLDDPELNIPVFIIGVDTYDKNLNTFILLRYLNGVGEVLLSKTTKNKRAFKEEVVNISKYFNAKIYGELD